MPQYEVYATRWDNPHIVEELIPARGLEFSLPLSDHGEASFTATVEPGRSFWRPSLALPMSGLLIARDGVPVWSGWVTDERPAGWRSFQFAAREWGYFFEEKVPAVPHSWNDVNDHQIFRDLISDAQAVSGQNVQIQMGSTSGGSVSDRTVNSWDDTTAGREFRSVGDAQGGPEWYFGTAGTLSNPVRQLILGDTLGHTAAQTVLEFVEDAETPSVTTRRAGGNLIAHSRTRSVSNSATVAIATGSGDGASQRRKTSTASTLLARGWPRMTSRTSYVDVNVSATLQAHAAADLAARAGVPTGYSLVSLDGDPDWTQTPRGSVVRVILDTDIYGADRPVGGPNGFDARLTSTTVRISDDGPAQVEWAVQEVLEVS